MAQRKEQEITTLMMLRRMRKMEKFQLSIGRIVGMANE